MNFLIAFAKIAFWFICCVMFFSAAAAMPYMIDKVILFVLGAITTTAMFAQTYHEIRFYNDL